MHFTAAFRVEGSVTIGGKPTRVSLPFNVGSNSAETRLGRLGLDANGDGVIDLTPFVGPEDAWVQGKPTNFRAGDHVVLIESADFNANRHAAEHAAAESTYVELKAGLEMPDFTFRISAVRGAAVRLSRSGRHAGLLGHVVRPVHRRDPDAPRSLRAVSRPWI